MGSRRRPRGHIEKRGPDSFRLWIPLGPGPDGKYRHHKEPFRGTDEEAEQRHTQLMHMMDVGRLATEGKIQYQYYLLSWLDDNGTHWSYTTHREYTRLVEKHIIPALGAVQLAKLTPLHIQSFYASLQRDGARLDGKPGPLGVGSVRQIHAVVRGSLSDAVDPLKLIVHNPAENAKLPKIDKDARRRQRRLWNAGQLRAFIAGIEDHPYRALILTLTLTGIRIGEALALQWPAVDFGEQLIHIYHGLKRAGRHPIIGRTKGKQERPIPMHDDLYPVLRSHRARMLELRLQLGRDWNPMDLVFPSEAGTPQYTVNFRDRVWVPLLGRLELPYINIHGLRHTFGTITAKLTDVATLRDLMGHHSAAFTIDEYVTRNTDDLRNAMKRFLQRTGGE